MIDLNETIKEKKNFFNRLVFVYLFFGMLFLFFLYRTFSLQVSSFTDYEIASLENKTREILIQPIRGIIYDRNGKIIVNNQPNYNLILKPSQIDNINEHINMIVNYIELSKEDIAYIRENFKRKARLNRELILKKNLSTEEIAKFESRRYKFPATFIAVSYTHLTLPTTWLV